MPNLYLTPAAISYLTQFLLSASIGVILLYRFRSQRQFQLKLLIGFFALVTLFIGLMFLDAAFSPYYRLLAVYAENTTLALALVFLIQFAYRFPRIYPQHKWESRLALLASLVYFLWEAGYMVYRYSALFSAGMVYYRPYFAAYSMAVILALAPIAFLRQCVAADPRPVSGLQKIIAPAGKDARGARAFVGVFGIMFLLGLFNVSLIFKIPHTVYNAAMSVGILTSLWLFSVTYINFIPGGGSVLVKLSVLLLTVFLALLGSLGWLIAPPYIATFQPNLKDRQTLRFTPNGRSGYDVAQTAFAFEEELGEKIEVSIYEENRNHKINFTFPFYGKTYDEVYVANSGVITFGEFFWQPNMQAETFETPAVFPLMLDLEPNPNMENSGMYARVDSETGRLIVTWLRLPAIAQPQSIFTFQAVLYPDGVIDIAYNGLPQPFIFNPDATPSANPWVRGVTSGLGESIHAGECLLPAACDAQGRAIIENYYMAFRRYLHLFMLPLAWVALAASLLMLLLLPFLLRATITEPLNALLTGISYMEAGILDTQIPVQNEDDIGVLTASFNKMASTIYGLVADLDHRVAERTSALTASNEQMRCEMREREFAQEQLLAKQRELAAFEEREKMSRELHDGLAQTIGFFRAQTQSIQTLLEAGNLQAAGQNLNRLEEAAQTSQIEIRHYILGLRSADRSEFPLMDSLRAYIDKYRAESGLNVLISMPPEGQIPPLTPAVEAQVIHIVQEALTNIRKHAEARKAEIMFSVDKRSLQLVISDDGKGFATQQRAKDSPRHFGLEMMRERAREIGGRLEIRSELGFGTKVILFAPLLSALKTETRARVLLVDDSAIFIEGLKNLLITRGLAVVGVARDGEEALALTQSLRPDIVVMDIMMPRLDGIQSTRMIKREFPDVKILLLTASEKEEHLIEGIKNGASGYMLKGMDADEFCGQLVDLANGETILPPYLAARVIAEQKEAPLYAELSSRQQDVLERVASGQTYKEVGAALRLSEKTVKYHMAQILERLHVENRNQAIAFARRNKLEAEEPPAP